MQEGTSIGLMTVVAIVGFGLMMGMLLAYMPELQQLAMDFMTNGVRSTPKP